MRTICRNGSKQVIEISFKDLEAVALLYNFLANNKKEIHEISKICNFYNYIEKCKFSDSNFSYKFVMYEEEPNIRLEKSLKIRPLESVVEIVNLEYIMKHFQKLPEEIIDKTLSEEALRLIRVKRDDLTIDSVVRKYRDHIDVHAMSNKSAIESAIKCLETYGYKNIRITNTFYQGMKNDHLYTVGYNADRCFDTLDQEAIKIKA